MGIKRTGEFRAQKMDSPAETVTLNKFLLESVYEAIDETSTAELLENASSYRRGNDPRLHHFIQVDREWFEANLLDELVN
jgi:CRISPR-associated protein Csc1